MARGFQSSEARGGVGRRAGAWGGRQVIALRVRDESMSDEGIHGGDYLLVERKERIEAGQTVLAEVDGSLTVKRLLRAADGRVRLRPANSEMLPLALPADRVHVVGAVVGVLRRHGFRAQRRAAHPGPTVGEVSGVDRRVAALGLALRDAEARAADDAGPLGKRLRELARSLRALRDCYLETSAPRLREALLREAAEIVRRVRRFGVERTATSA